ncbi:hypothetical protein IFM46972_09747, partial [Aspergillus udagawae]
DDLKCNHSVHKPSSFVTPNRTLYSLVITFKPLALREGIYVHPIWAAARQELQPPVLEMSGTTLVNRGMNKSASSSEIPVTVSKFESISKQDRANRAIRAESCVHENIKAPTMRKKYQSPNFPRPGFLSCAATLADLFVRAPLMYSSNPRASNTSPNKRVIWKQEAVGGIVKNCIFEGNSGQMVMEKTG